MDLDEIKTNILCLDLLEDLDEVLTDNNGAYCVEDYINDSVPC